MDYLVPSIAVCFFGIVASIMLAIVEGTKDENAENADSENYFGDWL